MTNDYHVTKFSGTKVFTVPHDANPATLIVDANSGSVTLSVLIDTNTSEWVVHETYTVNGIHKVEANGCTIRVECAGMQPLRL